jgi:hypothetical protein
MGFIENYCAVRAELSFGAGDHNFHFHFPPEDMTYQSLSELPQKGRKNSLLYGKIFAKRFDSLL